MHSLSKIRIEKRFHVYSYALNVLQVTRQRADQMIFNVVMAIVFKDHIAVTTNMIVRIRVMKMVVQVCKYRIMKG